MVDVVIRRISDQEIRDFIKFAMPLVALGPEREHERTMLGSDLRLCLSTSPRGYEAWGAFLHGQMVSFSATHYQKSKAKNAWGRYINWVYAFTATPFRHRGIASAMQRQVEADAVMLGYSRLKALAGSYAGVRLHYTLGHDFWGLGKNGEIVVDTPLFEQEWPETVPIEARARAAGPPARLTGAQLCDFLVDGRFCVEPSELERFRERTRAKV